jgi:hypothetical protein
MSFAGWCKRCGDEVKVSEAAYQVTGFEVARDGGGANQIRHRERVPNLVWHSDCVDPWVRKQDGGDQGSLL